MTNGEAAEGAVVLGHELVGSGASRVIVTNDWLCDTSTWDSARSFLDGARFTFCFADLRGYGRSRGRRGTFTLAEAARDVLALADALGWTRFAIVGHSMSALVALHLAQHHPERVARAVLLTPPPPGGFGADEAAVRASQDLARGDDAARRKVLEQRFAERWSPGWTDYKLERWRSTSDPEAVAGYVAMFARDGVPEPARGVDVPVLAITGEQDVPPMRYEATLRALQPLCRELVVTPLGESGHYPMQEMPPRTLALIESFLAR